MNHAVDVAQPEYSDGLSTKKILAWLFAAVSSVVVVWFCLGIGLGGWQWPHELDEITLNIRLPRLAVALIVGASLSAAGAALQALFDNPLADPSLIGTSGGAALGVVLILALGWGGISIPLAAFLGALAVCLLILSAHRLLGGGTLGLLILGFVISAFSGAFVSLILFLSDDLVLRSATIWLAGSLAEAGFASPQYAVAVMLAGLLLLLAVGRRLDILMLGHETAVTMGVSPSQTRLLTVIGAALLTGAAVSQAGVIGFLGMMVPNAVARSIGGGRRGIMLISAWLGAVFLVVVDSASRWVTYPVDVPVGIVIALLGGPFFLWIFLKPLRERSL
ncbi:FecCD family ABC transporter permease [Neisseria weaveri]|uniref:FecCD family ABC transporter permease n=1 Tax=Neisseria weaveri TaxID=28091 RepID=UPI0002232EC7|nr:iron ABC transporter permease [Neisseria weaveri]EGV37653.1 HmuU protein [Neisseria weaveri ATCC 51223]SAY51015.1 ABC transporter permease, enterobactin [Neisseria weaveri]